eukprot:5838149-Pleurochrysis_carterae.AAC.2
MDSRSLAAARKEAEEGAVGGGGDGPRECASRRASAIAARLLEGPGCLDVTGKPELVEVENPVLGHERAEEDSDIGRHLEAFGVHTEPSVRRGRGVPESSHDCTRRPWGWLCQRRGAMEMRLG